MGKLLILLSFIATTAVVRTTAFLHPSLSTPRIFKGIEVVKTNDDFSFVSSDVSLSMLSSSDSSNYDNVMFPKSRTDLRNFLTQRSIQSFVFLLNQCREEHTVRWLEVSSNMIRWMEPIGSHQGILFSMPSIVFNLIIAGLYLWS